jgi:hypothetical protein
MPPKTLKNLTVPNEQNTVFVSPQFSRWPALLLENKSALQKLPYLLEYRKELLNIAAGYTQDIAGETRYTPTPENIIVTGHQPTWHHCGILAKNLATAQCAKNVSGCAVHLVLDHDVCDSAMLFPRQTSDGSWHFESLELESNQNPIPLEFRPPPQATKIQALIDKVTGTNQNHFCTQLWSKNAKYRLLRAHHLRNIADFITGSQAMLNSALGLNITYLPVSLLAQSNAFLHFVDSIITDAAHFANSYNKAISHQTKHQGQNLPKTAPPLTMNTAKPMTELPFWLFSPQGRRTSLFATSNNSGQIAIGTASTQLTNLHAKYLNGKTDSLRNSLVESGYRLRPKAVSLTLFARLYLADLFVHGIGGACYEHVTDHILQYYYRIERTRFAVATATAHLPLSDRAGIAPQTISQLKQKIRNVKYSPEKFIQAALHRQEPVKSLIKTKNKLIETTKNRSLPTDTKKLAWGSISQVNKELSKYTEASHRNLKESLKSAEYKQKSSRVLNYREYFFGLFPEEMLRELKDGIAAK